MYSMLYIYAYSLILCSDDINCFGTGECFTLAFGVPAVLMILSLGKTCGVWNGSFGVCVGF